MENVIDSWKNEKVAKKQLDLNLKEISSKNQYPRHWISFIELTKRINPSNILDVGCGCGTFFELCKINFPLMDYTGVDYSESMIDIAKKTWNHENFFVKNYADLTKEYCENFDLVHLGAMLDVLPNGDEALDFILSLKPKNVILGRVKLTDKPSYSEVYTAYDEIQTYAYHHNINSFLNICKKHSYIISNIEDNFHLKLSI